MTAIATTACSKNSRGTCCDDLAALNAPKDSLCLLRIQKDTVVKSISVNGRHRREYTLPQELIRVDNGGMFNLMILNDIICENHTGKPSVIVNEGTIKAHKNN